ncbi:MAG: hypothetical protein HKM89_09135 [Gemmatimonadales bacterium]|nr:hypothetical protein [Gemmatimonadales bacterium]
MRRGMQFLAAITIGVAVAACSDDSPTVPSVTPQFVLAPGDPLVCDFPDANKANRNYFAKRSQSLADVKGLLGDMKGAGAGSATATSLGFDIFAIMGQQVGAFHTGGSSDVAGSPAEGSELANQVLACMDPAVTQVATAMDFSGSFESGGGFCVRGGGSGESPCITYDGFAGLAPPPLADFTTWFGLAPKRLIYAAPLNIFISNEVVVGGRYEVSTLPDAAMDNSLGKAIVGMCVPNFGNENRVQHREAGDRATITLLYDPTFLTLCFPPPPPSSGIGLLGWARDLFDWASPKPLFAAATLAGGGTGGGIDDLSLFAVVSAGAINLRFTVQPVDGFLNQTLDTVVVGAFGDGDTPFIDLGITLSIFGNNSVNATLGGPTAPPDPVPPGFGFCVLDGQVGTCSGVTDTLGLVRFGGLSIDKTGGYRLLAQSSDLPSPDSPDATEVVSNLFHIHP